MRVGEEFTTESVEMSDKVREKSLHRQRRETKEREKREYDMPRDIKNHRSSRKNKRWDDVGYEK